MANKITRTTVTTTVVTMVYDRLNKEITEYPLTLSGKYTDPKDIISIANKALKDTPDLICIDVLADSTLEIHEELREMDIATWMKYSKVVPAEE